MNIGKKIRELRTAKLMTQAELAGKQITRNMLSCIENGSAQPSLSTIVYIAGRLNVPAGFLLAEEGDEVVYRKMNGFANIKRAFTAGDFGGCRSLCLSACPEPDDEINLLLANCDTEIAVDEFWSGRLRSSCLFFDEGLEYAAKTMYPAGEIEAKARVFFRYMKRISPGLYSEVLDEDAPASVEWKSDFSAYLDALDAMDAGNDDEVDRYLASSADGFFSTHIRIRKMMNEGDYAGAGSILSELLRAETPLNKVCLFAVLCELEICCREQEDFKNAYYYANEKVELLEQLLKEA